MKGTIIDINSKKIWKSPSIPALGSIHFPVILYFDQLLFIPRLFTLFPCYFKTYNSILQAHSLILSSFYGIFFIDASSANRAEQGLSAMAERFQVGQHMEDFKRWLTNLSEDWLLIIDNADDPSVDILQYLPTGCRGTVVITTRNRDCRVHATVGSCEIGQMGREEAISLLLKASGEEEADTSLRLRALPVVETLWSLALAIIQAGAVIRQKLYTFEEYCSAYKTRRKELLSLQPVQASSDYRFAVYTTWEVSKESISAIANRRNTTQVASQTATNALELLTFFGFCHFDDIWEDLFKVAWEMFPNRAHYPWWRSNLLLILREDRPPDWDPFPFRQAMSLLSSYSLIQWSDHRVSLHPLVHSWIRDSLNENVQLRHWTSSVSTLAMMDGRTRSYSYYRRLMPHIQACLGVQDLKDLLIEDPVTIERAYIAYSLIRVYGDCFQDREFLLLSGTAMEYARKAIGDEHDLTWHLADCNALAHNNLREYQKTIDKLEMRVALVFSSSGAVTQHIAGAMNRLMFAYNFSKHTKQALELGEKLVPICIDTLGEDAWLTCNVMHQLAETYSDLGRTGEAVELREKVLERQKTFLSHDDETLLYSKHYLAMMYIDSGRIHEAVDMLRQVVEKRKLVLADDHIDTLDSQMELARAYDGLGQPGTGIPLLVDAISLGEKAGVLDAELKNWRNNLAIYRVHEAYLLWERRTEPFQPEVVISLLVDAIELGEKAGVPDADLQVWRRNLARYRAHEACLLWERGTEPFQPEVVISLLSDAIEMGEKAGVSDAELQVWRRILAMYRVHEAQLLWHKRTEPFQPEVVVSLVIDAIELGQKNGLSDEKAFQNWREVQEWLSDEEIPASERISEVDNSESKNS